MMAGPPFDPNTAAYVRLMTGRRRELDRGWPLVFVAFAIVVAIALAASAGGDKTARPPHPAAVSAR